MEPAATCTNHNFSKFSGYNSTHNQHTYYCSNANCTSYIVEECYNNAWCGSYPYNETLSCEKYGRGSVNIHNYVYTHDVTDQEFMHIEKCTNTLGGQKCSGTKGVFVMCSLEPTQIWRGFRANHGHYLKQDCSICHYSYDVGYYYPNGHPNYFDATNDCIYCKMGSPYHMDFDI